jgi:membrane protein DedA with SNARE-associated domain
MKRFRDLAVSWGPLGVFVFAVIDSAGVPNPGGTDLLLLAVTIANPASAWLCATLAVIGSIIGSAIFYEILSRGGEKFLSRMTSTGRGARFRIWFLRYGLVAVFIPALLPVPFLPYKALAGCASAFCVGRVRFLLVILTARVLRYVGLAYLGATLGNNSFSWIKEHGWEMGLAAVVLFVLLYMLVRFADRNPPVVE